MALTMIEGGLSKLPVARICGRSAKIVTRWVESYKEEGPAGRSDRSARPNSMPAGIQSQLYMNASSRCAVKAGQVITQPLAMRRNV
jgi:transposase